MLSITCNWTSLNNTGTCVPLTMCVRDRTTYSARVVSVCNTCVLPYVVCVCVKHETPSCFCAGTLGFCSCRTKER